jgi:thioredoxin
LLRPLARPALRRAGRVRIHLDRLEVRMTTQTATTDNIEQLINEGDVVVLDFWAEWCGPCRAFGPVFEAASERHRDVTFAKVNTEEQQELAAAFGVRAIPLVAVFRQKVLLYAEPGALRASDLEELISQAKALDIEDVKQKIAAEEAKAADQAN